MSRNANFAKSIIVLKPKIRKKGSIPSKTKKNMPANNNDL